MKLTVRILTRLVKVLKRNDNKENLKRKRREKKKRNTPTHTHTHTHTKVSEILTIL